MYKEPQKPKVCPICKENYKEALKDGFDIYGNSSNFILELKGTDADQILLRGWICSNGIKKGVFGDVIAYMKNGKRFEINSTDHVYMIFDGDKVIFLK